jgi:hypothetical protein
MQSSPAPLPALMPDYEREKLDAEILLNKAAYGAGLPCNVIGCPPGAPPFRAPSRCDASPRIGNGRVPGLGIVCVLRVRDGLVQQLPAAKATSFCTT